MIKKIIFITGSAIIGLISMLTVIFTLVGTGAIEVEQTKIVFSSESAEAVYSGAPLSKDSWSIVSGELKEGHTANVVVSGSQTATGSSPNSLSATVVDEKGADVTEHYQIEYQPGTLTVTPRPIEITANDAVKVYDGAALSCSEYTVTAGELAEWHIITPTFAGSIVAVGETPNRVSIVITDAEGTDVTSNYSLKTVDGTLTVAKRPIHLQSSSDEKVYDGELLECSVAEVVEGTLVTGHHFTVNTTNTIVNSGAIENRFTAQVFDVYGNEMTENYDIFYHYGTLTVLPVQITITTESDSKVYDGTPLKKDVWTLVSGATVGGDTINVLLEKEITDVGTIDNEPIITVVNENGDETTRNYEFTVVAGALTVTESIYTLVSDDNAKEYDGTALTHYEVLTDNSWLPDGHTVDYIFTASQKNVGETPNEFYAVVKNAAGDDVTKNFDLSYVFGTLTVTARHLSVSTEDRDKIYDGTELKETEGFYTIDSNTSLADGHTINVTFTGSQTNAGTSDNSFTVTVTDADNVDVTDNYEINKNTGFLIVYPITILLKTEGDEKFYDAEALTKEGVTVIDGEYLGDHTVTYTMTGSQTDAGNSYNTCNITVTDAEGKSVTDNYLFIPTYGILTVKPIKLTFESEGAEKTYDATPLTNENVTVTDGSVLDIHSTDIKVTGTITNVGKTDNLFEVRIKHADNDVSHNYDISYNYGILEVTPIDAGNKPITFESDSFEKIYDGEPLYSSTLGLTSDIDNYLLLGHTPIIEANLNAFITDAGEAENKFTVEIIDGSGEYVTDNYSFDLVFGTLTVEKRTLIYESGNCEFEYDGEPHMDTEASVSMIPTENGYLIGSHTAKIEMTGTRTDVGTTDNTFDITVRDGSALDKDVTRNYNIICRPGILAITARRAGADFIYFTSPSKSKIYDGEPVYTYDYEIDTNITGWLVDGHTLNISGLTSYVNAGRSNNAFKVNIIDRDRNDVTANYAIYALNFGEIRIDKRPIYYYTESTSKMYDGKELTYIRGDFRTDEYYLGIADGEDYHIEYTGAITEVGQVPNSFVLTMWNSEGNDTTDNYELTAAVGTLTVTPRDITFVSATPEEKIYDGTPLEYHSAWEKYSDAYGYHLLNGHSVEYNFTGSAINAGTKQNTFEATIYDDATGLVVTNNYRIKYEYGDLTVKNRYVKFESLGAGRTYNGQPLTNEASPEIIAGSLLSGHTFTYVFSGAITDYGTANNFFTVTIFDENGAPVTDNYNVQYKYGKLEIYKRSIIFKSGSANKTYDAEPLKYEFISYSDENYAPGDYAEFVFKREITNKGSVENEFEATVYNADGKSVTENYKITYYYGTLTVDPKSITIKSGSAAQVYDGSALTNSEYAIIDGSLVGSHTMDIVFSGEITNAGTANNTFEVFINDENGDPVTNNYLINKVYGNLTVSKRVISFTNGSLTKEYDGEPLLGDINSCVLQSGSLAATDSVSFSNPASITNAGVINNYFDVSITNDRGDATNNYEITKNMGTLTVTPRAIAFESATSEEKVYDGTPLEMHEAEEKYSDVYGYHLLPSHRVEYFFTGSQTNAGRSNNYFTAKIYDNNTGREVQGNYSIEYVYGILNVAQRYIKLESFGAEKIYGGTPLVNHEKPFIVDGSLVPGDTYTCTVTGAITDAGSTGNYFDAEIFNAEGVSVTNNYKIEKAYGILTVAPRPIVFRSENSDKTYDGKEFKCEVIAYTDNNFADGDSADFTFLNSITNVGSVANTFNVDISDSNGRNVNNNYTISYHFGTLRVDPRPITIESEDDIKVYDGTPLTNYTYSIANGTLVGGDTETVSFTGSVTDAGYVENTFNVTITDAFGNEVTSNYKITKNTGNLAVTPRPIYFTSRARSKIYDGTPLLGNKDTDYYLSGGELVFGHTAAYTTAAEITHADTVYNTFDVQILDAGLNDVTSNYDINKVENGLTVIPRPLTFASKDHVKIYDGSPLTGATDSYYLISGELVAGDEAAFTSGASITDAGRIGHDFEVTITSPTLGNVTDNYNITKSRGTLTVDPRPIAFSSKNLSKIYDGTPLKDISGVCEHISGDLIGSDKAVFTAASEITKVGSVDNDYVIIIQNSEGYDVSANYRISLSKGKLKITQREIVLTTADGLHEYDGKPYSNHTYTNDSALPLPAGHEIAEVVFASTSTLTNVGTNKNTIASIRITNGGEDVTENFTLICIEGTINVTPREITVRTASAEKKYDGMALTAPGWEIVSITGLVDGHEMEVAVTGTRTAIGESQNVVAEHIITDTAADGAEVTDNYEVTFQFGVLVVSGTSSGSEGEEESAPGLDLSGELGGNQNEEDLDKVVFEVYSEASGKNYLRIKSFGNYNFHGWNDAAPYSEIIGGKYSPNYLSGIALQNSGLMSFPVTVRSAANFGYYLPYFPDTSEHQYVIQTSDVIYTGDGELEYSLYHFAYEGIGTELGELPEEYRAFEEAYRDYVYLNYLDLDDETLEYMNHFRSDNDFSTEGLSLSEKIVKVRDLIKASADYDLKYDRALDDESNIIIAFLDTYKTGVCRHYASAATALYRSIGIPARYTIGYSADTVAGEWVEIKGEKAHAWCEIYIDGRGWFPVDVTGGSGGNGNGGEGGGEGGGGDETQNPNALTIQPETVYHKYDGNEVFATNVVRGLSKLTAKGYTYDVTVSGSGRSLGITKSTIESFTLYDPQGNDVTDQFEIKTKSGSIQVYIRELIVTTSGATKEYDGVALSGGQYNLVGDLYEGHHIDSLVLNGSQTNVGKSSNTFTIRIIDSDGVDVTSYYKIVRRLGTLEVTSKPLHVIAKSNEMKYSGEALTESGFTYDGELNEGETIEVTIVGSQTEIGRSQNTITKIVIKNSAGIDVTSNYTITFENGTLTVLPNL